MSMLFAAMIGWCGTRWPGWWWRWPHPPIPDPEPWWRDIFGGIIGAVGGAGAVVIFAPMLAEATLMETAATAFFGGVFLGSLGHTLMGAAKD